jgi:hypothetical protein
MQSVSARDSILVFLIGYGFYSPGDLIIYE